MSTPAPKDDFRQRMILAGDLAQVLAEHVWNLPRSISADGEEFFPVGCEEVPGYEDDEDAVLLRRESDGVVFEVDIDVCIRRVPTEAELAEAPGTETVPPRSCAHFAETVTVAGDLL
jgi:hypothetical protein